ncbi:MAG: hypothetical protein QM808_09270 [Steroidobacteraceae bacterium]
MKNRIRTLLKIIAISILIFAYPAFVLGYTWSHVASSDLPGGRNGPLDAYRHTLASAVVAYTLNARAVEWVTAVMEAPGRPSNLMDRHNNRLGASIGSHVQSFVEIEPLVSVRVRDGQINATSAAQVTWLPPSRWRSDRLW